GASEGVALLHPYDAAQARSICNCSVRGRIAYRSFFLTASPPTEIYTLSLHDALPIFHAPMWMRSPSCSGTRAPVAISLPLTKVPDRKSTRLNSSHRTISYAVFCLKKKNRHVHRHTRDRIEHHLHLPGSSHLEPLQLKY